MGHDGLLTSDLTQFTLTSFCTDVWSALCVHAFQGSLIIYLGLFDTTVTKAQCSLIVPREFSDLPYR